eukprot:4135210-Pyramimonas_sp.AAC.1
MACQNPKIGRACVAWVSVPRNCSTWGPEGLLANNPKKTCHVLQLGAAAPSESARAGGGRGGGGRGGRGRGGRGGGERGGRERFYDVSRNKLQSTLQHESDGEALLWEAAKDPSLSGLLRPPPRWYKYLNTTCRVGSWVIVKTAACCSGCETGLLL